MTSTQVALSKGQLLRLDRNCGVAIRVRDGCVWLTQPRDPEDYVMKSGEAVDLNGAGLTLIKAYVPTLLELYEVDPFAARREIALRARAARNEAMLALLASAYRKLFSLC